MKKPYAKIQPMPEELELIVGKKYLFSELLKELVGLNYSRVELVVAPGDLAVRGGLIDIFVLNHNTPLRLEFLGDELESIRSFQVSNQRSLSELTSVTIMRYRSEGAKPFGEREASFTEDYLLPDFKRGDYVVHENYGIAIFQGMHHLQEGSIAGEYYHLQYAGSEELFVPIEHSILLHRYSANEVKPQLSSLTNRKWQKSKQQVKSRAKNIAFELFQLYRQRKLSKGFAFSEDTEWQLELEQSFPYQETPDQLEAIGKIKQDMESPQPMDRLLCGDVGFGKTEVALRAAFKALIEGKQVAILAPTTILVDQHFRNFSKRFAGYNFTIKLLSRFNSPAENRLILEELKQGRVDLIIGTHRLLQKDVKFNDLGLLIIDEEQRFGVTHKEYLKKLAVGIDILTLSATPIPRTLYMSLSGLRDVDILATPPAKRLPIKTVVCTYNPQMLQEVISRELERQGQLYFLHNDIKTLEYYRQELLAELPQLRIAVAHGQLPQEELERKILEFIDHQYDLLLCTTIIENGIDIPAVNTIIINNADRFGLAQLHQIRGRVGRSDRQAYAYLCYDATKGLSTDARQRLHSLQEFAALGAGYKIALKDLELRGSGNVLGSEQSGFVAGIGFTLYCKIMEESIREIKGEVSAPDQLFTLPTNQENYIPADYMAEEELRISFYRRILESKNSDELKVIQADLLDRFGEIPDATQNLLTNIGYQLKRHNSVL